MKHASMLKSPVVRRSLFAGVLGLLAGVAFAAVPTDMQAIIHTGTGGLETLKLQTVPVRQPEAGQVLIKVYAAAVNPVDWKMLGGRRGGPPGGGGGGAGGPPGGGAAPAAGGGAGGPPAGGGGAGGPPGGGASTESIPGMDVAGVVVAVGSGVTSVKPGEAVFSMIGRGVSGLNGSYAQYTLAPATNVIAKPRNLTFEQAAGLGTVGMTAMRSVMTANIKKGDRVLVNGAAGGVGSSVVQIARARGATVIGTASARHDKYLKSIGVSKVVDYTKGPVADQVKDVDVVIDTVGGNSVDDVIKTLKKGGTFLSVAAFGVNAKCAAAGVTCAGGGRPGAGGPSEGDLLGEVAKLASAGKFSVHVDKTFPLADASAADAYSRGGHAEGKIILVADKAKAGSR